MNNEKFDIFVSYAHEDKSFVEEVTCKLSSAGLSIWIDKEIHHGESISSRIVKAIDKSKFVLFFSSQNSNASDYCIGEILVAVQKKKCVIPIKIDATDYCDDLIVHLIRLHYVNFINGFSQNEYNDLVAVLSGSFESTPTKIAIESKNGLNRNKDIKSFKWIVAILSVIICILSSIVIIQFLKSHENLITTENTNEGLEMNKQFTRDKHKDVFSRPGYEAPTKVQNNSQNIIVMEIRITANSLKSANRFENDIEELKNKVVMQKNPVHKDSTVTFIFNGDPTYINQILTEAEREHFEVERLK